MFVPSFKILKLSILANSKAMRVNDYLEKGFNQGFNILGILPLLNEQWESNQICMNQRCVLNIEFYDIYAIY